MLRAVSSLGAPKNIEGIKSRKVWVIAREIISEEDVRRFIFWNICGVDIIIAVIRLVCIPGRRPVIVPIKHPKIIPKRISIRIFLFP